jgi:hypothetical protein
LASNAQRVRLRQKMMVSKDCIETAMRGWPRRRSQIRRSEGNPVMAHYQAHFIGRDGHFMKTVDLICDDDDGARKCALQMVDGHDVELWEHDRRIAKFEGHP